MTGMWGAVSLTTTLLMYSWFHVHNPEEQSSIHWLATVSHCLTINSHDSTLHPSIYNTVQCATLPQACYMWCCHTATITQLQKACHKETKLTSVSAFVWNAFGRRFSFSSVSATSSPFIPTPHFSSCNDIRLVSLHEPQSLLSKFTQFWKIITLLISWLSYLTIF